MLNDYRADRDAAFKKSGENIYFRANMRILGSVSDAFLDTSLITIDEEFGGLGKYIREELDVTPELRDALRELYLEK
jgi:protein-tyrosine phosphatase